MTLYLIGKFSVCRNLECLQMTNKIIIMFLETEESTVGKGEKGDWQHFLLFSQCFLTLSYVLSGKGIRVNALLGNLMSLATHEKGNSDITVECHF